MSEPEMNDATTVELERLRAELQGVLQGSESRFRETADLLPGIICEFDPGLKLTYVNRKGLETFGFTPQDLDRGISALQVIPVEEQEHARKDLYNVFRGDFGTPDVYRLLRTDGSSLWGLVNSAPIMNNGTPVGMRTCIIDITDRIKAEERLRESEERFRSIYDQSPIGIAIFNTDGNLVEANRSYRAMFPELPESNFYDLAHIVPAQKLKLDNGGSIECEVPFRAPAGERILDWHATSLGPEKRPAFILAQVQDITERARAEERRLQDARAETEKANRVIRNLRQEMVQTHSFSSMVSRSPQMQEIFDLLPQMAQPATTILVYGESGTGKELIARAIHESSARKNKPFVAINCGALPDNLLESELFGYKAGAFTDAKKDKPGKFAQAEGGTIFLDEIGDISAAMQVKLLRVIQERIFEPLGATRSEKADVRIVAATNKDLSIMVRAGTFREDLYYRINVLQIRLPALRERRTDIPLLVEHFIARFNARYNRSIEGVADEALSRLLAYAYPGNIRELENVIERAFIFCQSSVIETRHLPVEFNIPAGGEAGVLAGVGNLDDLERRFLTQVLQESENDKTRASRRLGIHQTTLYRKMKRLNMQ